MPEINILDLVISLIITVAVYSLPIIFVRYAILKRPVERSRAKVVTITYAVVSMIVMSILVNVLEGDDAKVTFGGLLLWSYVNYKMLTYGKDRRKPQQITAMPESAEQAKKLPVLSFKAINTSEPTKEEAEGVSTNAAKVTYCKKCGCPIDNNTKKCTGCGKQYFHLPKVTLLRGIVIILIIALTGLAVFQLTQTIEANNYIFTLENKLQSTQKSLDTYKESYKSLLAENNSTKKELYFWDNYAVIVTEAGSKYHHYGCGHIEDKSFYIYNIDQAKALGYTPCLDCCSTLEQMAY